MRNKTDKEFTIEWQWKQYLVRAGVTEEKMSLIQKQETKRAFFGAVGQIILMMRDDVSQIEDEEDCIDVIQDCLAQVSEFWENEVLNGIRP